MSLKLHHFPIFLYFLFLCVVSTNVASSVVERLDNNSQYLERQYIRFEIEGLTGVKFSRLGVSHENNKPAYVDFFAQELVASRINSSNKEWLLLLTETKEFSHESNWIWGMDWTNPLVIPLPSSIWLLGSGLLGFIGFFKYLKK